jgi:endonuclease/exonuclease/phosphatase (EEP) superfamily protein YafD
VLENSAAFLAVFGFWPSPLYSKRPGARSRGVPLSPKFRKLDVTRTRLRNTRGGAHRIRKGIPRRIWRSAGHVLFFAIVLWWLGWLALGDNSLPIRWGAYVAPFLGLASFSAGIFYVLGKRPQYAIPATIIGILILAPVLPQFWPGRWFASTDTSDFKILTFNTSDDNTDLGPIAAFIVRERPDIIFLQQIIDMPRLEAEIVRRSKSHAYTVFPNHFADVVILSRFPLAQAQDLKVRTTAVVTIKGCHVRLWGLHAPHGHIDADDQARYFVDVARSVENEKLPVVVAGDLNSTEYNSTQAPLRAELRDAFAEVGIGLGLTFPSHVRRFGTFGRLFRIDHVFYRGLSPVNAWVVNEDMNSDHFPQFATFRLPAHCR